MSAGDFLDTNVLVYAYDERSLAKQKIARDLLRRAIAGELIISSQVLGEFATTLLHKLSPAAPSKAVFEILDSLAPIKTISIDQELVRRATEAHERYGLHFYDGLIVAAAERGGSANILSEDFHAGQRYFGVSVSNPFV